MRTSRGSSPSRLANAFESTANHTDWYPISTRPQQTASVPMLNVAGPIVTSENVSTAPATTPRPNSARPG